MVVRPSFSPALLVALVLVMVAPHAAADPPKDAFCVILVEAFDDGRLLRYSVDETTTLADRVDLWPQVDLNGDGRITADESDHFRRAHLNASTSQAELGVKAITVQGDMAAATPPMYTARFRQVGHTFHKMNYTMPGTLTKPIELETQEVRESSFAIPRPAYSFSIHGGSPSSLNPATPSGSVTTAPATPTPTTTASGPPPTPSTTGPTTPSPTTPPPTTPPATSSSARPSPVIEYVVIHAPPGDWVVANVEGYTYNGTFRLQPNAPTVDVPAFDTKAPYTITFSRPANLLTPDTTPVSQAPRNVPAAGIPTVLSALGVMAMAAVAAVRRRP